MSRGRLVFAAALVASPIVVFYAILFRFAVNIPQLDDYDGILNYLNEFTQQHSARTKFLYFLASQHNEYKLYFAHVVTWLQLLCCGKIDFRLSCALGNLSVLFLGALLWKMFLPHESDHATRLMLFAPVSLLLFQLNYVGTLDWAMTSLQQLPVLFFALASIYFLMQKTRATFCLAMAASVLAIASSGNGFFLLPISLFILLADRSYARTALWLAAQAICIAGYAYHYHEVPAPGHPAGLAYTLLHARPQYFLVFLGAVAAYPRPLSFALGLGLVGYFAYILRRGYWRRDPLICYCILFLVFTAVAVSIMRSYEDLRVFMASRYRIYGDLLLIFVWYSFVEEFTRHPRAELRRSRLFAAVLGLCCLFSLLFDAYGIYVLHRNKGMLVRGLALYEHPQPGTLPGPVLFPPNQVDLATWESWNTHARAVLDRSIQLGIYQPPLRPPTP